MILFSSSVYFIDYGPKVYIGTANGDVIAGSVSADTLSAYDIQIKYNNDGTVGAYSLLDTIAGLQRQIDDLRGG